jgi:hypothetical protein
LKTAVHVRGTLNDPADIDSGWSVEIAMPWSVLGRYAHRPAPPREGDQWRINFSRVEWVHEVVAGRYRKIAGRPEDNWVWSPQWVIDMHRPELWGYVQFTSGKPGKVPFAADPAWDVKSLLHEVYYAQRGFRDSTGRWAEALIQLRPWIPADSERFRGLTLESSGAGYVAAMPLTLPNGRIRRWHISHDARVWEE